MCNCCEEKKRIGKFQTDIGEIELFIECENEIAINSLKLDLYGYALNNDAFSINGNIKINYCPMCGKQLVKYPFISTAEVQNPPSFYKNMTK